MNYLIPILTGWLLGPLGLLLVLTAQVTYKQTIERLVRVERLTR